MKILVIDDEILLVEYLKRSFSRDNHHVEGALDGKSGLEKAIKNTYDAIVLDVIMPQINGHQVVHDLRQAGVKTPVIMLSSDNQATSKVSGLNSGADDYITKPFNYDELLARLKAIKRRVNNAPLTTATFSGITFEASTRSIIKDGQTIGLRPKELSVLSCLLENQGNAVSKAHLLHRVWGVSKNNASTRLEVCVRSLRSKVDGQNADQSRIKSIRGYGYQID